MLLPESELDILGRHLFGRPLDILGGSVGATEVDTDLVVAMVFRETAATEIVTILDTISHGGEKTWEVGSAKVGAGLEFGERIDSCANGVEVDVGPGILVEFLGEIDVNAEELNSTLLISSCRLRLGFERREKGLEPLE